MTPIRQLIVIWVLGILVGLSPWSLAAGVPTADEVMKSKGLVRVGQMYLLEADAGLADWLRQVRASEKRVQDALKRRSNLERELRSLEQTADELRATWDREDQILKSINKNAVANYNFQVDRVNDVFNRIRSTNDQIQKRTDVLKTIGDPSDEYVALTIRFGATIDSTMEKYKSLAADASVKDALEKINKAAAAKMSLGPSARLLSELPGITKLREKVNSDTIDIVFDGGVPTVPVTFNGTVSVQAVVDSGAAAISISSKIADQLGLVPGPGDRIVQTVTADGTVNDAHLMILKSVRLGKFTVENVQCFVHPDKGRETNVLLGETFLRRFDYHMDLSARKLKLSQIVDQTVVDLPAASAKGPSAATALNAAAAGGDAFSFKPGETRAWSNDMPFLRMLDKQDGFCVLTGIGGEFLGAREQGFITVDQDGSWMLVGDGVKRVEFVATPITLAPAKAFTVGHKYEWRTGEPRVRMIRVNEGFCILAGVGGGLRGEGEDVRVYAGVDGYWYLEGHCFQQVVAGAIAIKATHPAGYHPEVKEFHWTRGDPGGSILPANEGFCYLSGVGGAFFGVGEMAEVSIEDVRWTLHCKSGMDSMHVTFTALRFHGADPKP